jgi:hypothetical protein
MTVATVRAVLVASGAVTALVPSDRIEALRRTQSFAIPAITLTDVSKVPFTHLTGNAGLDLNSMQIDVYGATYTEALNVATAVRAALEADVSRMTMQSQIERNEPETDPELFQITQTWNVFS